MLIDTRKTPLLHIVERAAQPVATSVSLTLPFDQRQKSRQRVRCDDGREAALSLPRGTVLRHGDCLRTQEGIWVRVIAADEPVSTVFSNDTSTLACAAYHLGNRHVPLQIGEGWLRYLRDHVLDDMLRKRGLEIVHEQAPFQPESGAYQHGH